MKMRNYTFFKKATAIILSVLLLCALIAGFTGILWAAENDYYTDTRTQALDTVRDQLLYDEITEADVRFGVGYDLIREYEGTNFRFTITLADGTVFLSSYRGETVLKADDLNMHKYYQYYDSDGKFYDFSDGYTFTGYLLAEGENIFADAMWFFGALYSARYLIIVLEFLASIMFIITLIYLFCAAGRHPNEQTPRGGFIEKIPFDVFTACCAALFVVLICFFDAFSGTPPYLILFLGVAMLVVLLYLVALFYVLSFAIRIKTGGLFTTMLIWRICAWFCRKIASLFRALPLVWKTALIVGAVLFLDFIEVLIMGNSPGTYLLYWLIRSIAVAAAVLAIAITLRRLQSGGEKIASGNLDYKIDTSQMVGDFKAFGGTLNSIGDGMSKAVDERMKSERMKTELITNVSHDIKTPLTSIINYVDLIKKEDIDNENVQTYIAVLDRQSARLKKLIEDLVEASKASTGNLQVEMSECDIGVLLEQTVGEYAEKLEAANLEPIISAPAVPVKIMADGRYLWRVFDNLMGNICKYSLPGTRIYLTLSAENGKATVTFKNISRAPLNISGDELMERFVRGDSSRHTEGSGLGLSIAKSLAELQGGTLDVSADSDLFKATLTFKTIE